MQDTEMIDLLWNRDEQGLAEVEARYGRYIGRIAGNILPSREDVQECVNDALVRLWKAIPPNRPACLPAYLGKITRNEALKKREASAAEKRGGGQQPEALDELLDFLDTGNTEDFADTIALREQINLFLAGLAKDDRVMFVRRYWYCDTVSEIAKRLFCRENRVKVSLYRSREKLKKQLLKEGML